MEMEQRVPDLSDRDLERLHANAVRLAQSGTTKQREQAETLLPLLGAELEQRRLARVEAQTLTRRANNARRKDAVAVKGGAE
jgi:hypothetical protein